MEVTGKKLLGQGKWISIHELEYIDRKGVKRSWECVKRTRNAGAVVIICKLIPSGKMVLIRQFRPPAGKLVWEFPAGLLEEGEAPESAAIRELEEETGFKGEVKAVLPPSFSSPGLASEQLHFVIMEAPDTPEEARKTNFDESEDIETFLFPADTLFETLNTFMANGEKVDSKLLAYAAGMHYTK